MRAVVLGSGGWMPSEQRETTSVLVRNGESALVLDAGTGFRRLITEPTLLAGVGRLDVVLTHFHLDHVCGLAYVPALPLSPTVWAPGRWLYDTPSVELLAPLRSAPLSPFEAEELGELRELEPGEQVVGQFRVKTREQRRHWAPTAGLRVGDALALITDTAFDPESATFATGVRRLLHEAWSTSAKPRSTEGDATAAEAARVAAAARPESLTLIHLHPLADERALSLDARSRFAATEIGTDGAELAL